MATETLTTITTAVTKAGERVVFPYTYGARAGDYSTADAILKANGTALPIVFGLSFDAAGAVVTPGASSEIPAGSLTLTVNYASVVEPSEFKPLGPLLFAALGASTMQRGDGAFGTTLTRYCYGITTWLQVLSKGRLYMPAGWNFGVSGNTTVQARERIQQILALKPRIAFCVYQCGANDIALAASSGYDDILASTLLNIDTLANNGIPVVVIAPHQQNDMSATRLAMMARLHQDMRRECAKRKSVVWVEYLDAVLDPLSATYTVPTALMADTAHWNARGAKAVAVRALSAIERAFGLPDIRLTPVSIADQYSTDNPRGNRHGNPFFTGTTGTVQSGTVTGSIPTGFQAFDATGGATIVASKVADPSGWPDWAQLAVTGNYTGTESFAQFSYDIPSPGTKFAVGQSVYAAVDVQCSASTGLETVALGLEITQGGVVHTRWDNDKRYFAGPLDAWEGTLRTHPIEITAPVTLVRLRYRLVPVSSASSQPINAAARFRASGIYDY